MFAARRNRTVSSERLSAQLLLQCFLACRPQHLLPDVPFSTIASAHPALLGRVSDRKRIRPNSAFDLCQVTGQPTGNADVPWANKNRRVTPSTRAVLQFYKGQPCDKRRSASNLATIELNTVLVGTLRSGPSSNISRLSKKPELIRSVDNLELLNCLFDCRHGVGSPYNSYEQLNREPTAEDAPS
jgi:hypothetical protein